MAQLGTRLRPYWRSSPNFVALLFGIGLSVAALGGGAGCGEGAGAFGNEAGLSSEGESGSESGSASSSSSGAGSGTEAGQGIDEEVLECLDTICYPADASTNHFPDASCQDDDLRACRRRFVNAFDGRAPWPFDACDQPQVRKCAAIRTSTQGDCHDVDVDYGDVTCALEVLRDGEGEFEINHDHDVCGAPISELTRYRVETRNGQRLAYRVTQAWEDDAALDMIIEDALALPDAAVFEACLHGTVAEKWDCVNGLELECADVSLGCSCSG